jgi:hypothetical protein
MTKFAVYVPQECNAIRPTLIAGAEPPSDAQELPAVTSQISRQPGHQ